MEKYFFVRSRTCVVSTSCAHKAVERCAQSCAQALCAQLCAVVRVRENVVRRKVVRRSCPHKASTPKSMHNTKVLCAARCTTLVDFLHKISCAGTSARFCAEFVLVAYLSTTYNTQIRKKYKTYGFKLQKYNKQTAKNFKTTKNANDNRKTKKL